MAKKIREPKITLVLKKKKKRPKMDNNFVSLQKWEVQYIADKFCVKPQIVRDIKKKVGKSRHKIYCAIRKLLNKD